MNHTLFTQLNPQTENVKEFLDREDERKKRGYKAFLLSVELLNETIDLVDPSLISKQTLVHLAAPYNQCFSQLNAYATNGNIAHLNSFETNMHNVNVYISSMRIYLPTNDEGVFNRISTMKRRLTMLENQYNIKEKDVINNIDSLNNNVKQEKKSIGTLDKEIKELKNLIEKYTASIQGYFDSRAEKLDTIYKTYETGINTKTTSIETNLQTQYNEFVKVFEDKQNDYLASAKEKVKELSDLLDIAGGEGARAPYVQAAEDERISSRNWRLLTLASLFGFITLSIIFVTGNMTIVSSDNEIYEYLSKFFVFTGLGTLIGYSSKIAGKHKANHRFYRQMALELTSISLFINSLKDEEKSQIKKDLVEKYYAKAENPNSTNQPDSEEAVNKTFKMIEGFADLVEKVRK